MQKMRPQIYMGKRYMNSTLASRATNYKQYVADFGAVDGKRERKAFKTPERGRKTDAGRHTTG